MSILQKDSAFATQSADALALGYYVRPWLGVNARRGAGAAGELTQKRWEQALEAASHFGVVGFDKSVSAASYSEAVDTSYFKKAFPHVAQTDAKYNTLEKLAKKYLGSSKKWKKLTTTAKPWLSTLNIPAARLPKTRWQAGTFFWWK